MSRPYYRNRKKGEAQTYITKNKFKARSYIGYCKNNIHRGFVAVEALCKHECLEKECPYLHKFPEHPIYNDKKYFTRRVPYKKLVKIKKFIWGMDTNEAKQCTRNCCC